MLVVVSSHFVAAHSFSFSLLLRVVVGLFFFYRPAQRSTLSLSTRTVVGYPFPLRDAGPIESRIGKLLFLLFVCAGGGNRGSSELLQGLLD